MEVSVSDQKSSNRFDHYGSGDQLNAPGGTVYKTIHAYNNEEKKYPVKMRLPQLPNSAFTGRRELLDKIDSEFWLKADPKAGSDEAKANHFGRKMITLYGLAGAGKSDLARQYAYTRCAKYDAIFEIQAQGTAELETSANLAVEWIIDEYMSSWNRASPGLCMRIASALHMFEVYHIEDSKAVEALRKEASNGRRNIERLKAWLPGDRPWLLILDGYDDPKACDINSLLPSTGVGHVLITSQNPDVSVTDKQIAVGPSLGESESVDLLKRVAGKLSYCCPKGSDCQHAKSVVESVGGLPLAINIIGAYMREGKVTFKEYVQELLPSSSSSSSPEPAAGLRLLDPFRRTFEKLSQSARELMQLCSFIANTDVPIRLLEGSEGVHVFDWMKDSKQIEKAVRELCSFSLVSQHLGDRSLSIHSLVHKHAGTTIKDQERRHLSRRVVEMVTATLHFGYGSDTERWTLELSILPHANRCSDILRSELAPKEGLLDVETRQLTYRLAQVYSQLGRVQDVAALYELGLRDVEQQPTADLVLVVSMMNSFGISLRLQAKYDQATKWHARAKEFIHKAPPSLEGRLKALEAEQHMAAILMDQGRYGEAKKGLEQVLKQRQRELGENDALTLEVQTQHDLGMVLRELGDLSEALEKFDHIYQSRKERHGDNHPMTLEAAHSMAMVQEESGSYQKSLDLHMKILKKRNEYLGEVHYSTLETRSCIARLYERQGRYDEALQMYQEVQGKLEGILLGAAADHPWLLRVRASMADVELRQGKYADALEGYTSVYRGFKSRDMMLNNAWPTQTNMARVLRDIGRYNEALAMCEEALRGLQEPGGDPRFVTVAEFCKGTILELQGRFGEALQLYGEIVRKDEEKFGLDHLETLKTKCFVGSATAKQGRCEEALQLYEQIEEKLQPRTDDPGHLLVKLLAIHGKADVLEQLRWCDDAFALYLEVCLTREKLRLKKHPEYYRAVHGKGKVCLRKGEYEEGLGFLRDAIDGWKVVFGGLNHPLIFAALEDMGNALLQRGELNEARGRCRQALDGCQKMLGDGHPRTCRAKASLSAVLLEQNHLKEASEMCATGLRGLQAELGDNHLWTLGAARTLAGIRWRQYRYWEACRLSIVAAGGLRRVLAAPSSWGAGLLAIIVLLSSFLL